MTKYELKQNYANKKMKENAEVKSLTEEQHDLLSTICRIRHDLHCNSGRMYSNDPSNNKEIYEFFLYYDNDNYVNNLLKEVNLKPMKLSVDCENIITESDYDDFGEYDSFEEMEEASMKQMSKLNNEIEKYLKDIDKKHNTEYCPTGLSRLN